LKRVRLTIFGRVQGVFFRQTTLDEVKRYPKIQGWIRNRRNGTVEAVFQGPDEILEKLIQWCHKGPQWAQVSSVELIEEEINQQEKEFRIKATF
jgi:acylphosphatase